MRSALRSRVRRATCALLVLLLASAYIALRPSDDVPQFVDVRARWTPSDAYLLDRHGELLDTLRLDFGVRRSEWAPLSEISPALVQAVIDGEDRRFFSHRGVDWRGAVAAFVDRLTRGRTRGASTITMQLAGLIDEQVAQSGRRGSWKRKLAQVRSARGIETRWSKEQILEAYLNHLEFRGELQGVGAAARLLVGKAPSGLNLAESYVLAALLPAPGSSAARVASRACARAAARQETLSCDTLRVAARDILSRAGGRLHDTQLAPHVARALLRNPGEKVRATLDARVQQQATQILRRHIGRLAARNVRDAAAIVVENDTGDVLAYVGSGGPHSRAPQVDGVRARRQAGSTLKPFLYEMALERKLVTAATLLDDSPVHLETVNGIYVPQDYDRDYKGLVSVRTALASSLNIPAVRTLLLVGVEPFREQLERLGYAGIDREGSYYGFSLALGSAEVSLWEQAQAYRMLARGGLWSPIRLTSETNGEDVRLLSPGASYIVADILSDRAARTLTFGLDSHLNTPYWSAVKTGTSKDMRDNWCVGFSRDYTVAVWVGNFEGDSMHDVSGVTGAAPAWQEIMDVLHARRAPEPLSAPEGLHAMYTEFSPAVEPPRREWFIDDTQTERVVALTPDDEIARIASPTNGMVVAIDPDIPTHLQRLPLRARGSAPNAKFLLDGKPLGSAGSGVLWELTAGAHRLALVDASGRLLDQVQFTVR